MNTGWPAICFSFSTRPAGIMKLRFWLQACIVYADGLEKTAMNGQCFSRSFRNIANRNSTVLKRDEPKVHAGFSSIMVPIGLNEQRKTSICIMLRCFQKKSGMLYHWEFIQNLVRKDLYPVRLPFMKMGGLVLSAYMCGKNNRHIGKCGSPFHGFPYLLHMQTEDQVTYRCNWLPVIC